VSIDMSPAFIRGVTDHLPQARITFDKFHVVAHASAALDQTRRLEQFTSDDFTGTLKDHDITISMDGKGRCMDNIFVERLWRSLKYEEVYLNAYAAEAKAGIGAWLDFYNEERQHQSLGYRTPRQIYQEGLWICGRSALPTGSASPASRANSESGEMLAFAHIPTGTTANKAFDIDEMNSRLVEPAVALTAIGADIETGRAPP
jgi:putative transposase